MIQQRVKIRQINVRTLKQQSNHDLLCTEVNLSLTYKQKTVEFQCIPSQIHDLIYGFIYCLDASTKPLVIEQKNNHYTATPESIKSTSIDWIKPSSYSFRDAIRWVREFKTRQLIYQKTGATQSVGILAQNTDIIVAEDIRLTNAYYKCIGYIVQHHVSVLPIVLVSHTLTSHIMSILHKPKIILCQSAISSPIAMHCLQQKISLFGFCRKHDYNCYNNCHFYD